MRQLFCSVAAVFAAGTVMAQQSAPGVASGDAGRIVRLEILSTHDAYGGASFGTVGPYEVITGIVHGELDPNNPANAGIVDLKLAPRNADGFVEYSEDVVILRPKSVAQAKRVLLYDVPNRGSKPALGVFDFGDGSFGTGRQGNGLLLRMGYTIVWSGWQGDIAETGHGDTAALGTRFPVAVNPDGSAITGLSREEFVPDARGGVDDHGIVIRKLTYPAATLDKSQVRFDWRQTWRTSNDPVTEGMTYTAPTTPVPDSSWSYAKHGTEVRFTLPPGSDTGSIFEFVYPATNPVIMGIGFAAVRDLVTFLTTDAVDRSGAPNPLNDFRNAPCGSDRCDPARNFDATIMEGVSQSGRFARDFLWRGFNDDGRSAGGTDGHIVFNGMFPIIAGSRKTFTDFRWGQPGRWSRQHGDHWQPGDQFPFAYPVITDPVAGRTDGILRQCLASQTCPKIFQLDGGFEFFGARASLLVTDGAGHALSIPDNVRLYEVPGANHGGGRGVGTLYKPPECIYPASQVIEVTIARALMPALEAWVAHGVAPPPSQYPTVAAGTLAPPADQASVGFPDLSAAGYPYYGNLYNPLVVTDYSNAVPVADLSKPYTILVPRTDADGNQRSGVRVPELVAPIATYPEWNVRAPGHAAGDACLSFAATLPFAATRAARMARHDPRLSFAERNASKADYVAKVQAAAAALVAQRLLLPEDVSMYVEAARAETLFQ
jgi:hypothetical protein